MSLTIKNVIDFELAAHSEKASMADLSKKLIPGRHISLDDVV